MINQTAEDYQAVFCSKVHSALNLDALTRTHCKELDHFVIFSSISCGIGNPGQSNYGMANSLLERLCEERKFNGFPGVAVQYGLIGEVGLLNNLTNTTAVSELFLNIDRHFTNCSCLMTYNEFWSINIIRHFDDFSVTFIIESIETRDTNL